MSQQKKVLWKKIGLQKHILDGTSHSSQSKNTISLYDQFGSQDYKNSQVKSNNKLIREDNFHQAHDNKNKQGKNQQKAESNHSIPGSPIDNIQFDNVSNFQDNLGAWQDLEQQCPNSKQYSQVKFKKNLSKDSEAEEFLQTFEKNLKESDQYFQINKYLTKQKQKISQQQGQSGINFNKSQNLWYGSIKKEDLFIRFNQSQIQMVECQQMIVIPISQKQKYDKYESIQTTFKKLRTVLNSVLLFCRTLQSQKQNLKKQVALQKQSLNQMFKQIVLFIDDQVQEFKSQIGYLYKQNCSLMEMLSNLEDDSAKSKAKLSNLQIKMSQINQQNEFLYNKLNSNEQKMEQIQQLQSKCDYLQRQLQQTLKKQQKLRDMELTLMQKQRLLTISKKQIQHLKIQISAKKQHIVRTEQQFELKMSQLKFNIQLQKSSQIELLKQKIENDHRKKLHNYEITIQQLLRSLNQLQVQNIIKKFKLQKNQNILSLLSNNKNIIASNKTDIQFTTLKKYINKNTNNLNNIRQSHEEAMSGGSAGRVSPSFKSQKSHSQQKNVYYDYFQNNQNIQRQRSASVFSQRIQNSQHKVMTNLPSKRKEFVSKDIGDNKFGQLKLQDYKIKRLTQRKGSELNLQRYDRQTRLENNQYGEYYPGRVKTQIEYEDDNSHLNFGNKYRQSKGNQYSFSELNYESGNYQKSNKADFQNNYQNQSQESSTMMYLDMLQGTQQRNSRVYSKLNWNFIQQIRRRQPKTARQLLSQNYHNQQHNQTKPVQHRATKANLSGSDYQSQLAKHKQGQTSRLYNTNAQQNSNHNTQLGTYSSGVHHSSKTSSMNNNPHVSYNASQINTFTKINKTTGSMITSSFSKKNERQKQRSKSPIVNKSLVNKAYDISNNTGYSPAHNNHKQESQQSKNINRLLLARQFKTKH